MGLGKELLVVHEQGDARFSSKQTAGRGDVQGGGEGDSPFRPRLVPRSEAIMKPDMKATGSGNDLNGKGRPWLWALAAVVPLVLAAAIGAWLTRRERFEPIMIPSATSTPQSPTELIPSTPDPSPDMTASYLDQPTQFDDSALLKEVFDLDQDDAATRRGVGASADASGVPDREPVLTPVSDPAPITPAAPVDARQAEPEPPSQPREQQAAAVPEVLPVDPPSRDPFVRPPSVPDPPASPPAREVTQEASVPPVQAPPPSIEAERLTTRPVTVLTQARPRLLVEMLSADMSAAVELVVTVKSTGAVTSVRAVSGPAALRAPAEDTVKRNWTFAPAMENGVPVDGTARVTLTFGPTTRDMRLRRR